jgi:hypothetical protein
MNCPSFDTRRLETPGVVYRYVIADLEAAAVKVGRSAGHPSVRLSPSWRLAIHMS